MPTPRIEIDLTKISHNARALKDLFGAKGIDVVGVTKVVCGSPVIAQTLLDSGLTILADSRTANLDRMRDAGVEAQFLLLRTPTLSQAEAAVLCADISLNSEISVVRRLSRFAVAHHLRHKIILMVELGDLREGLMPADLAGIVEELRDLEGIELAGIGTNLACLGGISPDHENMGGLSAIAGDLERRFGLTFEFVSGGNSASLAWLMSATNVGRVNSVRLGEAIYLGRETLHREPIPGLFTDAFTLIGEVIESKTKPSLPYGQVGQDAFGTTPAFRDQGPMRRAILAIGLQDVLVSGLTPRIDVEVLGASSDHIVVNAREQGLEVGDEVAFDLSYGALLPAMTSPYVAKEYR